MDGLDRLALAIDREHRRQQAQEAIRALVSAGIADGENRALYAGAAQRLRDGLRAERVMARWSA